MFPRIPEWAIAMVGALKIGAIPIPCIEMLTARDIEYRVRNADAKAAVCRATEVHKFAGVVDQMPVRFALGPAAGWLDFANEMTSASAELTPTQTKGSGDHVRHVRIDRHPKAVVHAARALYAWRVSAIYWLDLRPSERIWCTADTG